MIKRSSGILLPISSLPSPYGIGAFGKAAYAFADFLKAAGQKYWQLLPLGPTSYGDSPYQSFSTYAGNPYFIDLDLLVKDKLLTKQEVEACAWGTNPRYVDYGKIYESRYALLEKAKENGWAREREKVRAFEKENEGWLPDYALFMALKRHFEMQPWLEWPEDIRLHKSEAVQKYRQLLSDEVDFWVFVQFLFFRQWDALRRYARERGVQFIGDVPIYVALDSADVWSNPRLFQLDEGNVPKEVAGVPPDAFTEDGQLWGNPLYDWDAMRADGFGWWIRRIEGAQRLYDVIRIDHFRGFESYWAVPYGDKTARRGRWKPGPGMALIGVLKNWFTGLEFIAEDLGYTTPEVEKLLADSGFPGMKILQFAFDPAEQRSGRLENAFLPHTYKLPCVVYTGTHDNDTTQGWLDSLCREDQSEGDGCAMLALVASYMKGEAVSLEEAKALRSSGALCRAMIRTAFASTADFAVVPLQDVYCLGTGARMNTPSTSGANWSWRAEKGMIEGSKAEKAAAWLKNEACAWLSQLVTLYARDGALC